MIQNTPLHTKLPKLGKASGVRTLSVLRWLARYMEIQRVTNHINASTSDKTIAKSILQTYTDTYDLVATLCVPGQSPDSIVGWFKDVIADVALLSKYGLTEELTERLHGAAVRVVENQVAHCFGYYHRHPPVPEHIQTYMLQHHPRILPYVIAGVSNDVATRHAPEIWSAWVALENLHNDPIFENKKQRWEVFLTERAMRKKGPVCESTFLPNDVTF